MSTGQYYSGQTFGPGGSFGDGNIFENCTFRATVQFGVGNTFVNCRWERCCAPYYRNPWSQVGEGAVVDGGYWDAVAFGANTTLKSGGGGEYSMGAGSTLDAAGRTVGAGGTYTGAGQIITNGGIVSLGGGCACEGADWDKDVRERGYRVLPSAREDASVEVVVPDDLIACKKAEQNV